jgi:hypothetical protein
MLTKDASDRKASSLCERKKQYTFYRDSHARIIAGTGLNYARSEANAVVPRSNV